MSWPWTTTGGMRQGMEQLLLAAGFEVTTFASAELPER